MKGTTNLTNLTNGRRKEPENRRFPGSNHFFGFVGFVVPSLFQYSKNGCGYSRALPGETTMIKRI